VHQHQPEFINIDQEQPPQNRKHGVSVADIQRGADARATYGADAFAGINGGHQYVTLRAAPNGGRLYVAKLAYNIDNIRFNRDTGLPDNPAKQRSGHYYSRKHNPPELRHCGLQQPPPDSLLLAQQNFNAYWVPTTPQPRLFSSLSCAALNLFSI
jgi:hypothetical protein